MKRELKLNIKPFLIFIIPIILFLEMCELSFIAYLLREPSDMAVFAGIVSVCVFLGQNYFLIKFFIKTFKTNKMKNTVLVIASILTLISCTRIDAGHEGILIKQYGSGKGVQDVSLVTGRVWYNPFTEDVEQYPTFIKTLDYQPFSVNAKDGSEFNVDPTISFNVTQGNSPKIFRKYRKGIDEVSTTTIFNYVKDAFRLQMNKYTTDEIVSNREKFEDDVQKTLAKVLENEGFHLEQLTSGLKYPQTIVDAVNSKNKAVQEAMRVENELRVAEAQAKKLIVQAEAEKKANELKQQSLTPLLIQQQFIEKWNGSTPLYGSSPTFFKNVN